MPPSRLRKPLLALNRVLGHKSAKSHMTSAKLGDTDALADDTRESRLRKVYEKRTREDEARRERDLSRERRKNDTQGPCDTVRPSTPLEFKDETDDGSEDGAVKPTAVKLSEIATGNYEGQFVSFTARLHHSRPMSSKLAFIVFRQQLDTIQGVLEVKEGGVSAECVRWAQHVDAESIMDVQGRIRKAPERVNGCSIHELELVVQKLRVAVAAQEDLPMDVYGMDKVEQDEETGNNVLLASNRVRTTNRIAFLRTPMAQSMLRIRSGICSVFRNTLEEQGFIEIQTPKLQPGATESGAEVFKVNYFGRTAFLAQSPQLAKQMAISSDLGRVFEIGPVFRAENSNTHRHLTEYTGLDLEMAIETDYYEAMDVIDELLKSIFAGIYKRFRRELDEVQTRFPHQDLVWLDKTPRLTFKEGVKLLNDSGWTDDDGNRAAEDQDLGTRAEIRLGQLVKEKYKTDYYILDKFPTSARPFYTRLDNDNPAVTNSFDIFVRGQEITTGGERINEPTELARRMKDAEIDPDSMEEYMQAFLWGAPRHAGCGMGLERILFLLLDLGDVRNATMFPRDPKSLPTRDQHSIDDVPFHEADTVRYQFAREQAKDEKPPLPELGKLIVNYGDSTNTSWLDDIYTVWRHEPTGAAIGYANENGYALIMGNPLCDVRQYPVVISAFIKAITSGEGSLRPIWLLCSAQVEELLGSRLNWRTLSVIAEQRVDAHTTKSVAKKERQAMKANLQIHETKLGEPVPEEAMKECDRRIEEWKEARKGTQQVHLTELRPWIEPDHRRYVWATDPEGTAQGLLVLHRLSPANGYQIKFALDFPGSPSGCIEALISRGLQSLAASGVHNVTFGAGATQDVEFGSALEGTMRAKLIRKTYKTVAEQLKLAAKTNFREKFGAEEDRVFICYPWLGLGVSGTRTLIKFFEEAV